jgi:hypothetical protein
MNNFVKICIGAVCCAASQGFAGDISVSNLVKNYVSAGNNHDVEVFFDDEDKPGKFQSKLNEFEEEIDHDMLAQLLEVQAIFGNQDFYVQLMLEDN